MIYGAGEELPAIGMEAAVDRLGISLYKMTPRQAVLICIWSGGNCPFGLFDNLLNDCSDFETTSPAPADHRLPRSAVGRQAWRLHERLTAAGSPACYR